MRSERSNSPCRRHRRQCGLPCRRPRCRARRSSQPSSRSRKSCGLKGVKQIGVRRKKMYEFKFHRPTTVRQAAGLLSRQEEAKLLAGGHTLIPTMKLRLAGPKHIIDMSKIEGLSGIEMRGRSLVIGALTTHNEVATSALVK